MSLAPSPKPEKIWTAEEFLALPDDGARRELIQGQVICEEEDMTRRNRHHGRLEARIARLLGNWVEVMPEPRGEVVSGETSFRLLRDPDTIVGVDVAYVSAELVAASAPVDLVYDGAPALAVEILSPSDQEGKVAAKVNLYLDAGAVVWVVSPSFRTLTVHRRGSPVVALGVGEELVAGPELPGFRVAVADLFA